MSEADRRDELPIGGTLAAALRLYRRHWKLLVPLGCVVLLPQALVDTGLWDTKVDRLESLSDYLKLVSIPLTVVLSLGGEALLAGMITALVLRWRLGHGLPELATVARRLAWMRLIATDVLIAFGAAIGVILLILPGLIFLAYFSIAPAVIEIEDRSVRDAFRRSAELVRGRVRRVAALVVGAILATELLAQGLLALVHGFLGELASELAVDALLESIQGLVIALVAITLIELHGDRLPAPPLERCPA